MIGVIIPEVLCGLCGEISGTPLDMWEEGLHGPLTYNSAGEAIGGICTLCHVHDIGDWEPDACTCVDCETNNQTH